MRELTNKIGDAFRISVWWSNINLCVMSNTFCNSLKFVFLYTSKISMYFAPRWTHAFIVVDINNPQTIHWSSELQHRVLVPAGSWRLTQSIDGRRLAYCGILTSSFRFICHHLAPVSWCSKIECHLVAALENMLLGLGSCFASVSWRWVKHNSDPTLDSPCSNLSKSFALRPGGSLTPNSSLSVLPLPNLLQPCFPELSWTWHLLSVRKKMAAGKHREIMMFNKWRRWSHSSRVKLPFVNISASWLLVSTYLIWILGSQLILSNNQSSATLWVLDTCLIVGLLP